MLTLSFNIVITIELLLDLIKKEDLLINLRMQEENSRILGAFLEMKNKKENDTKVVNKKTNAKKNQGKYFKGIFFKI